MPEAVIVSATRSPIGRANKGSLKDLRPDDLAATIVRAALDKVPALDPEAIDDLYLGCGLPGAVSGFIMAKVVNTLKKMDTLELLQAINSGKVDFLKGWKALPRDLFQK